MSPSIQILTGLCFLPFVAFFFLGVPLLSVPLLGLYAWVWLWMRPQRFRVDARGLTVEWPVRRRTVPIADVALVRVLTSAQVREETGFALRIGVGGLFGGFGLLWTRKRGFVDFYVTSLVRFVLVDRRAARPLLVTPRDAEGFAVAVRTAAGLA